MATNDDINAFWQKYFKDIRGTAQLKRFAYENRRRIRAAMGLRGRLDNLGERIGLGVKSAIAGTSSLFDDLKDVLGAKTIEVDRSREPTFDINIANLYTQEPAAVVSNEPLTQQITDALRELYGDYSALQEAPINPYGAAEEVTQSPQPKIMELVLADNTIARVEGFSSFEEILAKVEDGFPDEELPELLNFIRSTQDGVKEVSDAFSRQLFFRAAVQLVERSLDPETKDSLVCERLLFFAWGIKGLRPSVDQTGLFERVTKDVVRVLGEKNYPDATLDNVTHIFNRVRQPELYNPANYEMNILGGEPDPDDTTMDAEHPDTLAALVDGLEQVEPLLAEPPASPPSSAMDLGAREANAALEKWSRDLPITEGGAAPTPDGKVVPLRPAPPQPPEPDDPSSAP